MNLKVERKKMKIILLFGIFCVVLVKILAQKTITCKKAVINSEPACEFRGVTIGQNENVTIKTDPENLDVTSITRVWFWDSPIFSVPSEVFEKFPNSKQFGAYQNTNIQQIIPSTFWDGKNLEAIFIHDNAITFLHRDTFRGMIFISW